MQLEIVEIGTTGADIEGICVTGSLYWGCCIIHFWNWSSGWCGSECG